MEPIKATTADGASSDQEIKPLRRRGEDDPPQPTGPGDIASEPRKPPNDEEHGSDTSGSIGP